MKLMELALGSYTAPMRVPVVTLFLSNSLQRSKLSNLCRSKFYSLPRELILLCSHCGVVATRYGSKISHL